MVETDNSTPQSPFFSATIGPFENGVEVDFYITYTLDNSTIRADGWKISVGSQEIGGKATTDDRTKTILTVFLLAIPPTMAVAWYSQQRKKTGKKDLKKGDGNNGHDESGGG